MHPSFVNRCFLNNEGIILRLTYFYFHRTVLKIIWKEKNVGYSKVTAAVLISHFRGLLIVIFRRIKYNEEYQVASQCFFKLTLYWNSLLKFIFLLNTPKAEIFYILRQIVLFNAPLKKQIWWKIFVHGINRKIFRPPPGNLSLKNPLLVRLITKW